MTQRYERRSCFAWRLNETWKRTCVATTHGKHRNAVTKQRIFSEPMRIVRTRVRCAVGNYASVLSERPLTYFNI